ncbi:MAG: hypothetical protein PHW60_09825 [Kiritimatiellae bacterium]|nr:hypothetical protein [Kiritimatiellia bacterium]
MEEEVFLTYFLPTNRCVNLMQAATPCAKFKQHPSVEMGKIKATDDVYLPKAEPRAPRVPHLRVSVINPLLLYTFLLFTAVANIQGADTPTLQPSVPSPAAAPRAGNTTPAAQVLTRVFDTNNPLIITNTNSWFTATNWSQRLDWLHDTANIVSEQNIQRADDWFIDNPKDIVPFKPAKFRLGLQVEGDYFSQTNKFALRPLADTESEVHLPNAEKRLRLTISTLDPMALPGQDSNEGMSGFRVGLKKGMLKDIDTSVGVRIKWLPSIYANISWDPHYNLDTWTMYPEQKVGWESGDGAYETTSLMLNRWVNRCVIRPIASLKLSQARYNADMDKLNQERQDAEAAGLPPPDDDYLKGWDWELTLLAGYANELIDESVFGRLADGSDVAKGGGFRFSVLGGLHVVDSYNLTFLYRGHLYQEWLFFLIKPNVSWQNENNWEANYSLTLGLDMLIYGTKKR